MTAKQEKLDRRSFLKTTGKTFIAASLTTGGLASLSLQNAGAAQGRSSSDDIEKYDFLMPRVKFECV